MPQAWNMDGGGYNCGQGGFGFNIGDFAQDICVDNTLIQASQIDPHTPLGAERDDAHTFGPQACLAPMLLGALMPPREPRPGHWAGLAASRPRGQPAGGGGGGRMVNS